MQITPIYLNFCRAFYTGLLSRVCVTIDGVWIGDSIY
jgi:hypothetical protein